MCGKHQEFPGANDPSKRWIQYDGKKFFLKPGQSALEAMLAGGANIQFSCRKGTCRSCMLEATSGDPGEDAQSRLPEAMREQGFFLACTATNPCSVEAQTPDLSRCLSNAILTNREKLAPDLYLITLETELVMEWLPGQFLSIRNPDGSARSYSIVSRQDDYFVDLHIRHYSGGAVSEWLTQDLEIGGTVGFTGPSGTCYYTDENKQAPILLIGNGSGCGTLYGVARDALMHGHTGPIRLLHGVRNEEQYYLASALTELAEAYPNFQPEMVTCGSDWAMLADQAISKNDDLSGHILFLAGSPDMVEECRIKAMRQGVKLENLNSDPFDSPVPYKPNDSKKIAGLDPDPEIWEALKDGALLTEILDDFYTGIFENPRTAPFFHKVTKSRLIEKQYAFLADLFTGQRKYFGEMPFNSHHWMIISDELFDYRENMFFEVVRQHGFPEHLIPRWAAVHETFRREIVKSSMRGQWFNGEEVVKEQYVEEVLEIDTLCDGCTEEVKTGDTVLHHQRTGEIFCSKCANSSEEYAAA